MYEGTPAPASRARLDTNRVDIADAVCHCPPARPHTLPSYFSFDTGASAPPAHPPAGYLHGLRSLASQSFMRGTGLFDKVFLYGHADAADDLAQWLGVDTQGCCALAALTADPGSSSRTRRTRLLNTYFAQLDDAWARIGTVQG
ncbi:hypothetical protein B0H11DRAFT_2231750 [Mycena galericulata]|nr:hypothetical protein B0H11DRAFT_2231750 [Mycena galericulata]